MSETFTAAQMRERASRHSPVGIYPDAELFAMLRYAAEVIEARDSERDAVNAADAMNAAAEMLWVVIANVSGSDWTKQSADWQEATARWRDNYFDAVRLSRNLPAAPRELVRVYLQRELWALGRFAHRLYRDCIKQPESVATSHA